MDDRWQGESSEATLSFIQALHSLAERLGRCTPGILVENKKSAVAFHTRSATGEDGRMVARVFAQVAATCPGLRVIEGHDVVEVLPAHVSKGVAVERLRKRLAPGGVALFLGDDVTDEDAFVALDGEHSVTVLVGRPRETRARYRLRGPGDVAQLLRRLTRLRAPEPTNGHIGHVPARSPWSSVPRSNGACRVSSTGI
jgi:trehalose-phosphatase